MLALLGAHLVGGVRAQLAARLPEGFALILLNPLQSAEPLPFERFVRATRRLEGRRHRADRDVGRQRRAIHRADTAGEVLTGQILLQLPARRLRPSIRPFPDHPTKTGSAVSGAPMAPERHAPQ